MTAGEAPWWLALIVAPSVVATLAAVVGGVCYVARAIIASVQADRNAFLEHLKTENERSREERETWREALQAFRDDLREHTDISRKMYHQLERLVERRVLE